jgi:hypothetical protein
LDIDFPGNSIANDKKIIEEAFSEICSITCEKDGIHFDMTTIETEEINENHIYKGIRLHVTAQLDTARQRNPTLLEKAIHAMLKNRRTIYEENHPLFNDDFPINPRFPML